MLIGGGFEIVGDVGIMVRQRLSEDHIRQNPERSIGLWTKNSILGEDFFWRETLEFLNMNAFWLGVGAWDRGNSNKLKDIRRVAFMGSCFGNYQSYGTLQSSHIMLYFLLRNTWCPL